MPKSKQQNEEIKEVTLSKINETALILFAQKGLATSIGEIAQTATISTGLLYHYYKSKEELYIELVKKTLQLAETQIRKSIASDKSPKEKIKELTQNFIKDLISPTSLAPYHYMLMSQAIINKNNPDVIKIHLSNAYTPVNLLEDVIIQGQKLNQIKQGDPRQLTILYLATFNGLFSYKLMMHKHFIQPDEQSLNNILLSDSN